MAATAFSGSVVLVLLLSLSLVEARDHLIGGKSDAWKVSPDSDSLNRWASKTRFLIGDTLVWQYDGAKDSVLEVSKRDYVTCNNSSPISRNADGNTKVKLERSGPHYFISGTEASCQKGEKIIVVVLSEKHQHLAPAPSPAGIEEQEAFAPAPTSDAWSLTGCRVALGLLALALVAL